MSGLLTANVIARAAVNSSASMHEAAGRSGALPSRLKPQRSDVRVCGRAYPVLSPAGDNLWIHHAIYSARPDDVLVVATEQATEFGYWGEVMAVAARARGIAGLVIDGGVRDSAQMLAIGFPVFSSTPCIRGTRKNVDGRGSLGRPVMIGDVTIRHGDLVFGDCDGVVIVAAEHAESVVYEAERRDASEVEIFARLNSGASTIEIYGLPDPTHL